MNFTLAELAAGTGARLHGDGNCRIRQVAEISSAGEGSIAYVYNPRYVKYLKSTGASAVIVTVSSIVTSSSSSVVNVGFCNAASSKEADPS